MISGIFLVTTLLVWYWAGIDDRRRKARLKDMIEYYKKSNNWVQGSGPYSK